MVYTAVLFLHLIVAALTALVSIFTTEALMRARSEWYQRCARVLALLAGLEVLSGSALAVLSPQVSATSLCANIAVYLSVVVILEALLLSRTQRFYARPSAAFIFSPVVLSLVVFGTTLSLGL